MAGISRDHLIALACGTISAAFYLSIKIGTPGTIILAYLAQLPLFLAGLSVGIIPTAIASGIAAIGVGVGSNLGAAGLYLLLAAGPVLLIVRQSLLSRPGATGQVDWYPPGHLVGCLAGYGLVVLGLAAIYLFAAKGGIEEAARAYLDTAFGDAAQRMPNPGLDAMIESLARFFPAAVIMTWTFMVTINAVLAQGVLARFGHNLRPSPTFTDMTLPPWLTTALAVALLAMLLPGQFGLVAQNAVIILSVPFLFLGLAVIHAISRRVAAPGVFLILFYLILILMGWPAVVVAGIGLAEQWLALRRRFAPTAAGKEDE